MGFSIIKTSIRGDKPVNQDAILIFEDDTFVVLALADGLGSAPESEYGSKAICGSVVRCIKESIRAATPLSSRDIISHWDASLRKAGHNPKDCLTTSSFVMVNKKDRRVTLAQIGDSQIYVVTDDAVSDSSPEKDFANITECIGNGSACKYSIQTLSFQEKLRVLIASDGICDELEPLSVAGMAEYLAEHYREIPANRRNLALSCEVRRAFSKLNSDDKSMVFLWNN